MKNIALRCLLLYQDPRIHDTDCKASEKLLGHFRFVKNVQGVAVPADWERSGVICLHHSSLYAGSGIVCATAAGIGLVATAQLVLRLAQHSTTERTL